jgi:hypothetical protein
VKKRIRELPIWAKVLFLLWVALVLPVLYLVVSCVVKGGDASGWSQVAIELFGLPILLYGLICELPRQIEARGRRAKIEIGVHYGGLPLRTLRTMPLKGVYECPREDPSFELIIRNGGRAAATNVKIHFEFNATVCPPPTDVVIKPQRGNQFQPIRQGITSNDFVFSDIGWYLPPGDVAAFSFCLCTSNKSEHLAGKSYFFDCLLVADGLESPVSQQVQVRVL